MINTYNFSKDGLYELPSALHPEDILPKKNTII